MKQIDLATRCYALLLTVPEGRVTTYKELAHALGTKAYRAIGQIMNRNPDAPRVPCHRVVNSSGQLGGYAFGIEAKVKILRNEGVRVEDGKIVNFRELLFKLS